jgi:hypothetical protein
MAVRKTGVSSSAQRIQKTTAKSAIKPHESVKPSWNDVQKALTAAVAPGAGKASWLSEAEVKNLVDLADKAGPEARAKLEETLAEGLKTGKIGGQDLKLGDAALKELAALTQVPAGTYRSVVTDVDKKADHALAEGLVKQKAEVADGTAVQTKNQLDTLTLEGKTGAAVSKSQFTPHYKAAQLLGNELKKAAGAHLDENHPEAKAAIDAMAPSVESMVGATVDQIKKDPEALARVSAAVAKVGEKGFADAVKLASPDVAKAFTAATGVQMMNPEVVSSVLSGLPKLAEKISPELAKTIAKHCADCGAKLGVKVGAKGAGKAAAAGGKAVPGLGNIIAIGSACLSAVGFFKELFAKPPSGERVAKGGMHLLTQLVGIAFPPVALVGDLADLGWSAKLGMQAAREGKESAPAISRQDAAPLVAEPARLLASVLEGAGHGSTAASFRALAAASETASQGNGLEKHQMAAVTDLAKLASAEVTKLAAQEQDPAVRDSLSSLAHGFGELFKVGYQHKRMKGEEGPKREDLKGQLVRITGDIAFAAASLAVDGKGPVPEASDAAAA